MEENVQRRDQSVQIQWNVHSDGKKNVYFSKATFYWLKCSDLEGKESRKNMLHISSSYLNKNNIDDQKVFSLSGLVLTEYSFFFKVLTSHAFIWLIA